MMNNGTPHNEAKSGDIAKTVLMPGDPLRAKLIADTFLEDTTCFNTVRNMLGFTGTYNGKRVSVMGSGMGMPSIGIYSYELFKFYDVDNIIRIGSAGSISQGINLMDVIIALGACTDSNFACQYKLRGTFAPIASFDLAKKAKDAADSMLIDAKVGNILSSDIFYDDISELKMWSELGVLAVEMEAAALYMNAAKLKKNALCLLTISDNLLSGDSLSHEDRLKGFSDMMEIALKTV